MKPEWIPTTLMPFPALGHLSKARLPLPYPPISVSSVSVCASPLMGHLRTPERALGSGAWVPGLILTFPLTTWFWVLQINCIHTGTISAQPMTSRAMKYMTFFSVNSEAAETCKLSQVLHGTPQWHPVVLSVLSSFVCSTFCSFQLCPSHTHLWNVICISSQFHSTSCFIRIPMTLAVDLYSNRYILWTCHLCVVRVRWWALAVWSHVWCIEYRHRGGC